MDSVKQPFHGCSMMRCASPHRGTSRLRATLHCGVIDEGTRSTREVLIWAQDKIKVHKF